MYPTKPPSAHRVCRQPSAIKGRGQPTILTAANGKYQHTSQSEAQQQRRRQWDRRLSVVRKVVRKVVRRTGVRNGLHMAFDPSGGVSTVDVCLDKFLILPVRSALTAPNPVTASGTPENAETKLRSTCRLTQRRSTQKGAGLRMFSLTSLPP